MLKDKRIAVVIPMYNAEKYIRRCIKSVLRQDYPYWTLWVIDDGSTDHSAEIVAECVRQDSRIHYIYQENSGAGAARNKGIDSAEGNYLVFIDADDYIEKNYFSLLMRHSEDIVFIDVCRRNEKGIPLKHEKMSVMKEWSKDDILRSQMTGKILWGGVRKAVKVDLVKDYHIRYSTHTVGEEAIYSFEILYRASTVGFINAEVYNYEVHEGSLSQTIIDDPWGEVAISLCEKVTEIGVFPQFENTINSFFITAAIVSLCKMSVKYDFREYKKKALVKYVSICGRLKPKSKVDYKHMNTKAKILLPFLCSKQFLCVYVVSKLFG